MRVFWIVSVILFVTLGCGGDGLDRVPIQGEVVIGDKPLAGASVQFFPIEGTPGEGALGVADDQGKFEVISSRRDDKGVPPGKYKVSVSRQINKDGTVLPSDAKQADFPDAQESVPEPYSSSAASPLIVTIPEKGGLVKVELPKDTKLKGKK